MNIIDYEETKQQGSPDFPIEYYFLDHRHIRYVMQLHWHREFELIRVLAGKLRVFLNNKEYLAQTGDIIFVSGHTLTRAEPEDCVYECIVFDLNMIRGFHQGKAAGYLVPLLAGDSELVPELHPENTPLYKTTVELFETMCAADKYYELAVCGILNKLFFHLLSDGRIRKSEKNLRGHKKKIVASLISWIEKNYTEKITLADLAAQSGFNEKYLCRVFREFTGQPPTEYINRLRVERAAFEMSTNRKSVTDAAYESGFNELSHFSRTFKKYKGFSPREFKAQINKE